MATTTITATASVRVRGPQSPETASAVARTLGEALGSVLKSAPGHRRASRNAASGSMMGEIRQDAVDAARPRRRHSRQPAKGSARSTAAVAPRARLFTDSQRATLKPVEFLASALRESITASGELLSVLLRFDENPTEENRLELVAAVHRYKGSR